MWEKIVEKSGTGDDIRGIPVNVIGVGRLKKTDVIITRMFILRGEHLPWFRHLFSSLKVIFL
jgi:hypothetical protein